MKTIGILGGMSWESTAVYYRLINQGIKSRLGGLHSARILINSLDFEDIAALQRSGDWDTAGAHLARAALEGIAFQVADVLTAMEKDSEIRIDELRVDGGACVNDLLMQFQADLLGVPVVRPENTETTALGAAYLAGLKSGIFADREAIAEKWKVERTFEPQLPGAIVEERMATWQRAVQRAKGWCD